MYSRKSDDDDEEEEEEEEREGEIGFWRRGISSGESFVLRCNPRSNIASMILKEASSR